MTDKTLREVLCDVVMDIRFEDDSYEKGAERILAALHDYVPSEAMDSALEDACEGDLPPARECWRVMIQAAMEEQ